MGGIDNYSILQVAGTPFTQQIQIDLRRRHFTGCLLKSPFEVNLMPNDRNVIVVHQTFRNGLPNGALRRDVSDCVGHSRNVVRQVIVGELSKVVHVIVLMRFLSITVGSRSGPRRSYERTNNEDRKYLRTKNRVTRMFFMMRNQWLSSPPASDLILSTLESETSIIHV